MMKLRLPLRAVAALLCAALFLPTLLTACGPDSEDPADTDTPAPGESTAALGTDETPTPPGTDPETDSGKDPGTDTDPEEEETVYPLTGPNSASIMYADTVKNDVQVYYADQRSRDVIVENRDMLMKLNTLTTGEKYVTSLQNKQGGIYLQNTMDVYLRTAAGDVYYASDSKAAGRLNIYRYGYYYYNAHILDQEFTSADYLAESELPLSRFKRTAVKTDIKTLESEDTILYQVTSTTDPHIGVTGLRISTAAYNAVEVVLRAEHAAVADLYFSAGSHGSFNGDQCVHFTINPGTEFLTYIIPLTGTTDYTGDLTGIRFDIGSTVGERVEIQSIRFVKTDEKVPAIALDRTLHTYPDKLHQETHLVTKSTVTGLAAYGMTTTLAADRVAALIAKDRNGTHTALDGVDFDSLEYIGFDVKDVGVFGYIKPITDGGKLTITLADGIYTVTQEIAADPAKAYQADTHLYMGTGLYTDTNHTFDAFLTAAEEERHPLAVTVTDDRDIGAYVGYNALRGAYELSINGTPGFQYNYENYVRRTVSFKVTGGDADRRIYLYTVADTGETLESAVVLDAYNRLLPIPVEVCKNFGHEKEEPVFVPNDDRWGEAYFPFIIEAGKETALSVINLYYDWGKFPLKQISSISFNAPYYHLSTGATETNCIANYFISFMSNNLLPDFRPMSQRFWTTQPQHTAGGVLNFLSYTDASGQYSGLRHTEDEVLAYGPTYADIEMSFSSYDDRIAVTLDHIEMPQTDENRTYYTYTLKVLEDIEIADFKRDVTLFTMLSTNTNYQKLGYLDEKDQPAVIDTTRSGDARYITLGKTSPYYDLFVGNPDVHEDGYTNLAAIFRDYNVTVGGNAYDGHLLLRESFVGHNQTGITLDLGAVTLKAGDAITIHLILMPWGEGQDTGISETDDIVHRVRLDSCIDPFAVEAKTGTVIPHPYVPMVKAEGGKAEFTVSGGNAPAVFYEGLRENRDKVRPVTVRVYGFDAVGVPVVEEYVGGKWVAYDLTDKYAYDGYMVHYEGDGTYSYSFNVEMKDAKPRTLRVTLNTDEKIFADIALRPGELPPSQRPETPEAPTYDGHAYTTNCINSLEKMAFDTLYKNDKGTLYQPTAGSATAYISSHPITLDDTWTHMVMEGWAGYANGTIVGYGYRINEGELIIDPNAVKFAEEGVINAGGQSRFRITVPLTGIDETLLIRTYILLEDGTSVEMTRFWALGAS